MAPRSRPNLDRVRGLSEDFLRTWDPTSAIARARSRERAIGDVQMLLTKPACRGRTDRPLDS